MFFSVSVYTGRAAIRNKFLSLCTVKVIFFVNVGCMTLYSGGEAGSFVDTHTVL